MRWTTGNEIMRSSGADCENKAPVKGHQKLEADYLMTMQNEVTR